MNDYVNIGDALWQLCMYTNSVMKRARQIECNRLGVSPRNIAMLNMIIRLDEEATLSNIAEKSVLEVHSVSAQLTRMEREGLIQKIKDPKKKNLMHIRVTGKGYEYSVKGMERQTVCDIMSVLTEKEQHDLWVIMDKMRKKSIVELGKEPRDLYPPSDPGDVPQLLEKEREREQFILNKVKYLD